MRSTRVIILIVMIILLGVLAAVVLLPQLTSTTEPGETVEVTRPAEIIPTITPIPMVSIVVAVQELPRGITIPADGVQLARWPAEAAPFNALQSLDDVVGKIARTDIPREVPVLSTMLVDDLANIATVGSDAAAVMPPGRVAISIPMDRLTGVAYAIREGDYVDIILSMLFVDIDEEFQSLFPNSITLVSITEDGNIQPQTAVEGRLDVGIGGAPVIVGPSEIQRPRLVTQRTVQSAWVLRVGNFPLEGSYIGSTPTPLPTNTPLPQEGGTGAATAEARPPAAVPTAAPPDIITLAVTPQDAVVLVWAIEARIPITLVLRSARDISEVPTDPVTLEYIMTNFNISAPDRLPYALEPALRSIRQLIAFQEIKLRDTTDTTTSTTATGQ
jgi:Flp pilus assembly protein CpaB